MQTIVHVFNRSTYFLPSEDNMTTAHDIYMALDAMAPSLNESRPEYPSRTMDWFQAELGVTPGRKVLELYGGAGKLTSSLLESGADVDVVEPGTNFRAILEQLDRSIKIHDARAECLPLDDASVDIVTVSQAFHWFDVSKALNEIHRVLRPGGTLGVLYARRVHTDPAQKGITRIIKSNTVNFNWRENNWRGRLAGTPRFSAGNQQATRFYFDCDEDLLVQHVNSIGFVAAAPADARATIEAGVRSFAQSHGGNVRLLYEAVAIVCHRADGTTLDDDGFIPGSSA